MKRCMKDCIHVGPDGQPGRLCPVVLLPRIDAALEAAGFGRNRTDRDNQGRIDTAPYELRMDIRDCIRLIEQADCAGQEEVAELKKAKTCARCGGDGQVCSRCLQGVTTGCECTEDRGVIPCEACDG